MLRSESLSAISAFGTQKDCVVRPRTRFVQPISPRLLVLEVLPPEVGVRAGRNTLARREVAVGKDHVIDRVAGAIGLRLTSRPNSDSGNILAHRC